MHADPEIPFPSVGVTNLISSLRGALSAQELVVLVGQLVVWIRHSTSPSLNKRLASLGTPSGELSGPDLERIVGEMARDGGRPLTQSAFLREDAIRYERIDPAKLRALVLELQYAVLGAPVQLADTLIQGWTDAASPLETISAPPEIASTMLLLANSTKGEDIYCLGAAAESAAIECMRQERVPFVLSQRPPLLALLYSLITKADISVLPEDPQSREAATYFQTHGRKVTLAVPPIGMKATEFDARGWRHSEFGVRTSEALVIECIVQSAATRAVILVPNGVLFRAGAEQRLRQFLVERGYVHAIVAFPPGLLSATGMPFSLLILDTTHPSSEIRLYEVDSVRHIRMASGMLKHRVRQFTGQRELIESLQSSAASGGRAIRPDESRALNYNLNVNRFRTAPSSEAGGYASSQAIVAFEDLATIVKPQAFRAVHEGDGGAIREVSPGELPQFDFLTAAPRERRIDPLDRQRFAQQRLMSEDVLLSTKGTIGRTGIAGPISPEDEIYPSQSILILRLNPSGPIRDPVALLMYLRSPYFQAHLRSLIVGSTIPNVAITDLRRSAVRVPTISEQQVLRKAWDAQRALQFQLNTIVEQQQAAQSTAWAAAQLLVSEDEA
jgi:type I restriction enzyme M protein